MLCQTRNRDDPDPDLDPDLFQGPRQDEKRGCNERLGISTLTLT